MTISGQTQTITFGSISAQTYGTPVILSATATSGLIVKFTSLTQTVCSVSASTVTLLSTGNCVIQATQGGNAQYTPPTPVSQSSTVNKAATNTVLTAAAMSPTQSQPDLSTATVTGAGQLGGSVMFVSGGVTICTSAISSSGIATCSLTHQPQETWSLPLS